MSKFVHLLVKASFFILALVAIRLLVDQYGIDFPDNLVFMIFLAAAHLSGYLDGTLQQKREHDV